MGRPLHVGHVEHPPSHRDASLRTSSSGASPSSGPFLLIQRALHFRLNMWLHRNVNASVHQVWGCWGLNAGFWRRGGECIARAFASAHYHGRTPSAPRESLGNRTPLKTGRSPRPPGTTSTVRARRRGRLRARRHSLSSAGRLAAHSSAAPREQQQSAKNRQENYGIHR